MSFILSAQRCDDVVRAFEQYRTYLQSVRQSLPESVFALASSDWYFSPEDPWCPHDARLQNISISESRTGNGRNVSSTAIRIHLVNAHDDGVIELFYPHVFNYSLNATVASSGHRDWRYDEFRLSDHGNVVHEIEWWGPGETARWIIEASDVHFQWHPGGYE
ncbi:MAG: hypothetical protein WCD79_11660 [Chthoniobacteraceae bacterium]